MDETFENTLSGVATVELVLTSTALAISVMAHAAQIPLSRVREILKASTLLQNPASAPLMAFMLESLRDADELPPAGG